MAKYLYTMVRITDPEKSRAFYEAVGMEFRGDFDIVRNGEREATELLLSLSRRRRRCFVRDPDEKSTAVN